MLNHVVAFGLRSWHSFWTPVKAWADYHQDHNGGALQFYASAATVVGLPILTLLVLVAVALLVNDRIEARRQRASRRKAILLGLAAELGGVRDITSQDAVMFALGNDVWTVLPHTAVERALIEAGSLDLTAEQILELHELQLRISKANSLVHAWLAVPRTASGIRDESSTDGAGRYSRRIRDQFKAISGLCDTLLAGLQTIANYRSLVGFASQETDREGPESGREASEAARPSA